jgi:hypothetical protein
VIKLIQGIGEASHARMCHIGGFVSSDHIIPTPIFLSAQSPPSPLPQQPQQKQQLPSYSNPIVGAIVAVVELQQQHASLTYESTNRFLLSSIKKIHH